ncbi:MAG: tetratricopeptide repeat protein, partial [Novosphingobium sp.]|nr:tetratricopeptide repeat protein [Novosphingobium sp.]
MAMIDQDAAEVLRQAQSALQQGRLEEALGASERVLRELPDDADALYMAAVACRYAQRFDDAGHYLAQLHAVSPEFGRAWQEEGHLARAQGEVERALAAYDRACRYNPALEASWRAQMDLFAASARTDEASVARAQAERLASLPRELVAVTHHLHEGRLLRAEEICRNFLRSNPRDVEAMRLLAVIGVKLGVLDDAEFLLESAVSFAPENIQLRLEYIDVLRRRQKFA